MTFLDLVKALRSRVGMQGSGPASVTSATTSEMDLVNATSDSWIDIQNFREDWRWMRGVASFSTSVGTTTYSLQDIFGLNHRLKRWLTCTAYITVNGQKRILSYLDYDSFISKTLNQTTAVEPKYFTFVPWDYSLLIEKSNGIYPITIGYQKTPQVLMANEDVPELVTFDLLIIYQAIQKYSVIVFAPELFTRYANQYDIMIGQLMRSQLPKKKLIVRGIA